MVSFRINATQVVLVHRPRLDRVEHRRKLIQHDLMRILDVSEVFVAVT